MFLINTNKTKVQKWEEIEVLRNCALSWKFNVKTVSVNTYADVSAICNINSDTSILFKVNSMYVLIEYTKG